MGDSVDEGKTIDNVEIASEILNALDGLDRPFLNPDSYLQTSAFSSFVVCMRGMVPPDDFERLYNEYMRMFPDAEDPGGLSSAYGVDGVERILRRAVSERKRIVIIDDPEKLDGTTYHLVRDKGQKGNAARSPS